MQEYQLTIMHHFGKKGDEKRLEQTLSSIEEVREFKIDLPSSSVNLKASAELNLQHVINEINTHTGFKAF